MAAIGNYIVLIRDRLVALHEADAAWKGATAAGADRQKVRPLNIVVRAGGTRQNFKRVPGAANQPGDLPSADFRFMRLGPGPGQVNPFGAQKSFGNTAPAPACGTVTTQTLVYRVSYRTLTEDVATALLTASQRILAAARNQLAGTALPALSYVAGAAVASAQYLERQEGGALVGILDSDIAVNVQLKTADLTG